ncbi:spore coat protein U-like protein [Sphingopyxis sp. OAS728]|uniref:Csu type fimbrial protein n=1 Tax=Sphingopyxis sp. OAS728 TaxID=2663823 RepID=UPI001788E895|nr:spore coat U domain-containing protein [Sphingopyxis sp. OAS728]MBE1529902.1 spore coat protein U-like protein [Sphingopyxis sp. OAS728]
MTDKRLRLVFAGVLPLGLLAPVPAQAACSPLSLCSCTVSATGVAFGSYNTLAASPNDAAGSVRVVCTLLLDLAGSFTVDLSPGASNNYAGRTLRNGTNSLVYNLYTNAARTQIWGNGTGSSLRVTQSFAGLLLVDRTIPVYGRIPARQNARAGAYSDTIIVTVTY